MGKMIPIGIIIRCAMENFIKCVLLGGTESLLSKQKTPPSA